MAVTLTYYGHSAFLLSNGEVSIIFDPFLKDNTWKTAQPEDIKCQYIFVSHGHSDHYGDTNLIGKANNAMVISTVEVGHLATEAGLRTHQMQIGGKYDFEFGSIRLTQAFHGSGVPGGLASGCVIDFYGTRVYFAGDTGFFGDMKYISRHGTIDYALLPIGGNYTMDIEDALFAASIIKANTTIPIHYKTWPIIDADPNEFVNKLQNEHKQAGLVVVPGSTIEL